MVIKPFPLYQLNGGEEREGVEKEARLFSVMEFVLWEHEDQRIVILLTMRIWVDLTSGRNQTPYRIPSFPSLFPLFSSQLFPVQGPHLLVHAQYVYTVREDCCQESSWSIVLTQ